MIPYFVGRVRTVLFNYFIMCSIFARTKREIVLRYAWMRCMRQCVTIAFSMAKRVITINNNYNGRLDSTRSVCFMLYDNKVMNKVLLCPWAMETMKAKKWSKKNQSDRLSVLGFGFFIILSGHHRKSHWTHQHNGFWIHVGPNVTDADGNLFALLRNRC